MGSINMKSLKEWEEKELGEVCELIMGQSPTSNTYNYDQKGLPFFQGKSEFGEMYPIPVKWCSEPIKIALPNDILISVRAPVGAINFCNIKCCIGRGLAAIRSKQTISYKFLYYVLRKNEGYISSLGQGSTFMAIGKNSLSKVRINVPPLSTQQKIVSILEKADEIRQKQLQNQKHSEELFNSLMQKAFSGDLVK